MYPEPELSDAVRLDDSAQQLVTRATRVFWDAVGQPDGRVSVTWDVVKDHAGRDEFRLILRDDVGGVAVALFTPDALSRDSAARGQYYRVYERLLRERTRVLLRELNELIAAKGVAA